MRLTTASRERWTGAPRRMRVAAPEVRTRESIVERSFLLDEVSVRTFSGSAVDVLDAA